MGLTRGERDGEQARAAMSSHARRREGAGAALTARGGKACRSGGAKLRSGGAKLRISAGVAARTASIVIKSGFACAI